MPLATASNMPKGYANKPRGRDGGTYKQGKDGKWYSYQDLSVANRRYLETKFELDKIKALNTPAKKQKRKAPSSFSTPPPSRKFCRLRLVTPENPKGLSEEAMRAEEEKNRNLKAKKSKAQKQRYSLAKGLSEEDRKKLQNLPGWLEELREWLLAVDEASESTCQQVMRQVVKMASGVGITYHHWKTGTWFYRDTKIDLSFDFDKLYDEAVDMEDKYGIDLGNGWLMRHPLVKLKNFQQYKNEQDST